MVPLEHNELKQSGSRIVESTNQLPKSKFRRNWTPRSQSLTLPYSQLLISLYDKIWRNTTSGKNQNIYHARLSKLFTSQVNNCYDIFSHMKLEKISRSNCHQTVSSQEFPVNRHPLDLTEPSYFGSKSDYRKVSNTSHTKSQNLNASRLIL